MSHLPSVRLRQGFMPTALFLLLAALWPDAGRADASSLDRTGTIWGPHLEWALENPSWQGNPYDLVAEATFRHEASGRTHRTQMFHDGGDIWKFRFTGTEQGTWRFTTSSDDPELDGKTGTVSIGANPDPAMKGFVAGRPVDAENGSRWIRTATGEAFVPQYVMYSLLEDPDELDAHIETFLRGHGFTGFHVPVFCRWFDIGSASCGGLGDQAHRGVLGRSRQIVAAAYTTVACGWLDGTPLPCPPENPDRRTFEALETIIARTYEAGGVVHLWMWGDRERNMTPHTLGGLNGEADQRLQRYIAARLGPLPGWTMGYGFDLDEWTTQEDLERWRGYMHAHLGWPHMLGARSAGPNRGVDHAGQHIHDGLDYAGYEHHQPDYEVYVAALRHLPDQPAFSEDRFRIRQGHGFDGKGYTEDTTRLGMWRSAMAGGVANIWGRIENDDAVNEARKASKPYRNAAQLLTWSRFFADRFLPDMVRDNAITDGWALRSGRTRYLFYKENAASIRLDLEGMDGAQDAVAVDARSPYREIPIGRLASRGQLWAAPYRSDWAIAVGSFAPRSHAR
ncbi:DUF5060 domain-containing protein [Geminicoccaceae bacterium 1502E]|nr:DUF5060 domain-containing protein [Geminicoccaceae bacterium 1502E]